MAKNTPTLNVLISSKQKEFAEERAAIRAIMEPLPLLIADAAEEWAPQGRSIRETFLERARECAIYVGLFGCVYSQPTIDEYRAAAENPYREILIYVKHCRTRDAELTAFLDEVSDADNGRTMVSFENWSRIQNNFEQHLWAALQRMIAHCLQIGKDRVALGRPGASERVQRQYQQALLQMGLPGDAEDARYLADQLGSFVR